MPSELTVLCLKNTVPCMSVNCETLSFVFRQTRDVEELKNLLIISKHL